MSEQQKRHQWKRGETGATVMTMTSGETSTLSLELFCKCKMESRKFSFKNNPVTGRGEAQI